MKHSKFEKKKDSVPQKLSSTAFLKMKNLVQSLGTKITCATNINWRAEKGGWGWNQIWTGRTRLRPRLIELDLAHGTRPQRALCCGFQEEFLTLGETGGNL